MGNDICFFSFNFEKFSDIVNKNTELGRHWRGLKKTKKLILLIRATNDKYGNELIINQSEKEFIITTHKKLYIDK